MKHMTLSVIAMAMLLCGCLAFGQNSYPHPNVLSAQQFNLNGVWHLKTATGEDVDVHVQQAADHVKVFLMHGKNPLPLDPFIFEGTYTGDVINGKRSSYGLIPPGQPVQWTPARIMVADPDHMHFQGMPTLYRISPPLASDARCDASNSSHIQGEYAAMRGEDAAKHNDASTASCWFHTGAMEGNPRAEANYAWLLESGKTGTKDFAGALVWAKKGAEARDSFAALLLEKMYANGEGVPVNAQTADYWKQQARQFLVAGSRTPSSPNVEQATQQHRGQDISPKQQAQTTLWDIFRQEMSDPDANANVFGGSNNRIEYAEDPEACKAAGGYWVTEYKTDNLFGTETTTQEGHCM